RLKDDQNALHNDVEGIYSASDQYTSEFDRQKSDRERSERELLSILDCQPDLQVEFQRVMQASQTYMALRETVKYQFVKEYSLLRDVLVEIADRYNIDEQDIFSLDPREIEEFVLNPQRFEAQIAERQERFDKYSLI